jgi:tetratricopeptide (TPR) repeat protein
MDTENMLVPPALPAGPPAAYLELLFGAEAGRRCPLAPQETFVGRGEDADFVLDDPTVSRRHLRVSVKGKDYWLEDLGSANGTRVDGQTVTEAKLAAGTTIELGSTVLQLGLGMAPAEAPPTGVVHRQETVKMPSLAAPSSFQENAPEPVPPRRILGIRRTHGSRSSTPSPLFAQFVSWLVVLCLALGGVILLLNLLDSGLLTQFSDPEGTSEISSPRQERAMPIIALPKPMNEETGPGDLPADDAPDVALERFNEALAAEQDGDLETAVALLKEVSRRYPEFHPVGGRTVVERVNALERAIAYAGTIQWGREVLSDEDIDAARLQRLLTELSSIPATEPRYGEEAMSLAEQTRRRIRSREVDQRTPGLNPSSADADVVAMPEEEDVAQADSIVDAIQVEPSEQQMELVAEAEERAGELYRRGAFSSGANRLLEAAAALPEGDVKERLTLTAQRFKEFETRYEASRRAEQREGGSLTRVELLEKALRVDQSLHGKYARDLRTELSEELARLAAGSLNRENYAEARQFLDRARKHDRSAREVAKLANLFAFRAAALLREAQKQSDPEKRLKLAREALSLSASDTPLAKEAAAFLKQAERGEIQ